MLMSGVVVFLYSLIVYGEEECAPGKYGTGCQLDCPENCRNVTNTSLRCNKDNRNCYEGCNEGFYGDLCKLHCSTNCQELICNQHNGYCSEGCIANHIGDFCEIVQDATPGLEGITINFIFLYERKFIQIVDFAAYGVNFTTCGCQDSSYSYQPVCHIITVTTNDSQETTTTIHTRVAPTISTSGSNVGIQVVIPVVITVLVVLVGSVCAVIISMRRGIVECGVWQQTKPKLYRRRRRKVPDPEEETLEPLNSHDESKNTDLHIACKNGKVDEVRHVLSKSNTSIYSRGLYGWTPLMTAARYGRRGVFDFLVSKGCDEVTDDDFGKNILHIACLGGDLQLVKSILSKEIVGVNSRGHCGRTPIMAAARMGHKHVLKMLLSGECDASQVDDDGNNILHYACIGGHLAVAQYILKRNIIDINSKGKHGMTPVIVSVEVGHRYVFDFLVNKRADLSQVDDNGNNILHVACIGGNIKMAKHIISQNMIDMNSKRHDGRTAAMMSVEPRCREVLELLVNKGADLSLIDNYGNNILHLTCSGGNVNMVKDLLTKDIVDINSKGQNGRTPLMCAAMSRQNEVIDVLVRKGADATLEDDDGNNILHYACIGGHLAVVQHILNKNIVDINSEGKHGMTPVMISAEDGHREVFDFLIDNGADLSRVSDHGNTSLHLACLSGHVVILKHILSKHIVDINSKGQSRRTPVMMAAQERHRDAFVLLVSKGTDMSHVDENNDNILHLTCRVGHIEMVKLVLSHGIVDIDCTGRHMRTPVMMAAENGHEEVYNVLVNAGANLSHVDVNGNNILHLGCLGGSVSIVQNILSKNVININAMNNDGSKAATIASEQGDSSLVELLMSQPTS